MYVLMTLQLQVLNLMKVMACLYNLAYNYLRLIYLSFASDSLSQCSKLFNYVDSYLRAGCSYYNLQIDCRRGFRDWNSSNSPLQPDSDSSPAHAVLL